MNNRDVLDSMDKSELVELILQYSDEGFYPSSLFTMSAEKYAFSVDDLQKEWEYIVDQANAYEDDGNGRAADVLGDGAELVFKQAQRLDNESAEALFRQMVDDLETAALEDGIGMQQDAEWMYLQVKDEIEECLGK